ncbi:hypothetical protein BC829DRAFT_390611 [Chytridium lagenaria]|nr:hypothetical protein BC829DRAFT_390611 [Chytridium lagenaria]
MTTTLLLLLTITQTVLSQGCYNFLPPHPTPTASVSSLLDCRTLCAASHLLRECFCLNGFERREVSFACPPCGFGGGVCGVKEEVDFTVYMYRGGVGLPGGKVEYYLSPFYRLLILGV